MLPFGDMCFVIPTAGFHAHLGSIPFILTGVSGDVASENRVAKDLRRADLTDLIVTFEISK